MKWLGRKLNKKGQATTELAIMGTVVIMLLAYLLQQGYVYNCRQALEMYAFRKALETSRGQQRGINLTVIRDIISPSFFTGLNRQRLMATAAVDYNPSIQWIPYLEDPEDISSRQLLQVGEAMIRKGSFLEIPPTLAKIETKDNQAAPDSERWQWMNSAVSEIDPQSEDVKVTQRTSKYNYDTTISESQLSKSVDKTLRSEDTIPTVINFEPQERIVQSYVNDDWEGDILMNADGTPKITIQNIPADANLVLDEVIRRDKVASTPR